MIFESERAVVSTLVKTGWLLMKDERERSNALGGEGMWFLWLLLAVCRATGSGTVVGWREERRLADEWEGTFSPRGRQRKKYENAPSALTQRISSLNLSRQISLSSVPG
jgi:hypothetical protein